MIVVLNGKPLHMVIKLKLIRKFFAQLKDITLLHYFYCN